MAGRIDGTLSGSYATGFVSGNTRVGGLVGVNRTGGIDRSYADSVVSASGGPAGGLVGLNQSAAISLSYATGSVDGSQAAGGLVGVTMNGAISQSYASGAVGGSGTKGGLVGSNSGAHMVNNYWDKDSTGQAVICGIDAGGFDFQCEATGLSTEQALTQASYSGWNFTDDWFMIDGSTRPFLRSEWSQSIGNAHQLQLMAMDLTADYTLASDIDFGTTFTDGNRSDMWATSAGAGAGFAPIGRDPINAYSGVFDGKDFTIRNLVINRAGTDNVGLFGMIVSPGVIRNVVLEEGLVKGRSNTGGLLGYINTGKVEKSYAALDVEGNENVGGLVGYQYGNESTITLSRSSGNVSGVRYVGGLAGYSINFSQSEMISQSYATGNVSGTESVGGLVGILDTAGITASNATGNVTGTFNIGGLIGFISQGKVNRSYALGQVDGDSSVGGLAGYIYNGTVEQSYAAGDVEGSNNNVGGLVGYMFPGVVRQSYAAGAVSGTYAIGGLVGRLDLNSLVEDAYAIGSVRGNSEVGGLVGRHVAAINRAYAAGRVTGTGSEIGGLVGRDFSPTSTISSAYYDAATSGHGGGNTTAVMKRKSTFLGWDFGNTWMIEEGKTYPVLQGITANLGKDVAPPAIANAMVQIGRPNIITVAFDEEVSMPRTGGFTVKADGLDVTVTGSSMVGSSTIELTISASLRKEQDIRLSYDSQAGSVMDLASNPMSSVSEYWQPTIAIGMRTTADGKAYPDGEWTNQSVTVTASVYDNRGVTDFIYSLDGGETWTDYASDIELQEDGVYTIDFKAINSAGIEKVEQRTVKISTNGLTLTPTLVKADGSPYASGSWTNQSVTVSVYAGTGASGIDILIYRKDGGDEIPYRNEDSIPVSEDGLHAFTFQARNKAGNSLEYKFAVNIDKTAPSVTFAPNGSDTAAVSAAPTVSVSDALSGPDDTSLQYAWTTETTPPVEGWLPFTNGTALKKENANGDWYLHIKARDKAGNESIATSNRFRLATRNDSDSSDSSNGSEPVLPSNTYQIGLDGGSVPFEGGELSFPAGAMDRPFRVTIAEITDIANLPLADGERLVSRVFEFKKDVPGKFLAQVTVKLRLNADATRQDGTEFLLCWLDEASGKWVVLGDQRVDDEKGTVSGTTDHFTKFAVIAKPSAPGEPTLPFTDLKGHWAEAAILKMAGDGAVSGYPDGTFRPDRTITRAEFASILAAALQWSPTSGKAFADTEKHWAREAISTAYAQGAIRGYDDDTFAPDEPITREQMAVMAANVLHLEKPQAVQPFADGDRISKWARDAVEAAAQRGILSGYPDQTMRPQAHATRAEAVLVITHILEKSNN
ncbi:S-layer homology domain-containing protein [Cohnella caldifontis]|uniref:S-layer homology domain-containing protein n=1 Tax=Cohnella caldifontis TaxID=3027471 RepID=UPI0023ECB90D|nr:S-layer homology domain-containing protein [Cohnella sp. YIM B05605]